MLHLAHDNARTGVASGPLTPKFGDEIMDDTWAGQLGPLIGIALVILAVYLGKGFCIWVGNKKSSNPSKDQ